MIRSRTSRLRAVATAAVVAGVVATAVVGGPAAGRATAAPAAGPVSPRFDVDGDGVTDRIAQLADGTTTITRSTDGSSAPFTIGNDAHAGKQPKDIVPMGNLYGTAAPELMVLWSNGDLIAFEQDGTHAGGDPYYIGPGWQMFNKILSPGDVTGDGRPDLLGRTPEGTLYLYRTTGTTGLFAKRVAVGSGWQVYDQLVGTGDVDGDRIGDILARTVSGDLYFYKGTGSATGAPFKARVKVGYGFQMFNQLIAADDLNADGRADFLARTPDGTVYRYLASGGGKFSGRQAHGSGGQNVLLYAGGAGVPAYGKHELLTIDDANQVHLRPALSDGRFGDPVLRGTNEKGYFDGTLSSALDERGKAHLVEIGPGYAYTDGVGFLGEGEEWNSYDNLVGPGDLTSDGKGDVVGQDFYGSLYLHKSERTAAEQPLDTRVRVGGGWGVYDQLVSGGDHSGDGRPDLIARTYDGELYLYKGTGSASAPFTSPVLIGGGWNTYTTLASPGDMTGDGRADLIGVTAAGDVYRYAATGRSGTATFSARVKFTSGWQGYEYIF
ncbi:FG-GAP repeat domain-containing protein [Streptomyces sp. NPDC015127]|uniref:FG-GAP repeat domain-containing protein n=1 Tax=Streptomyces sp. NPDC015127 TaxID=3364939 RepID=UPI003700CA1A